MENLSSVFQNQKREKNMKNLNFITQLKIEFLLPNNGSEKCLEKSLISSFGEFVFVELKVEAPDAKLRESNSWHDNCS